MSKIDKIKVSDKDRIEIRNLANDIKQSSEQIKLCLFNGCVIENVSKNELKSHLKNIVLFADLINKTLKK